MVDEVTPEIISATQKLLGKYVTKPPLTEKLLRKPPFRFLHDVVNTVIRETGFLKGLFSEVELQSDNVKDRETKIDFLNKLITAVKTISGIDLEVRASKIIAGLEPAETNKLLQAIGTSIDAKLDSKEYVNQLKGKIKPKSKEADKEKKNSKTISKGNKSNETLTKKTLATPKVKAVASKASTPRSKGSGSDNKIKGSKEAIKPEKKISKTRESPKTPKVVPDVPQISSIDIPKDEGEALKKNVSANETPRSIFETLKSSPDRDDNDLIQKEIEISNTEKVENVPEPEIIKPEVKVMNRPKSARPRSGDFKERSEIPILNDPKILQSRLKEIKSDDSVKLEINHTTPEKKLAERKSGPTAAPGLIPRPKSLLRPPSVRPSSARPGAPRLRLDSALPLKEMIPLGKINVIVENYSEKDGKDEEETVIIQSIPDDILDPVIIEKSLGMPADKGHLVEQILEQIQGPEQLEDNSKSIERNRENSRGKDATSKEINQLRVSIQSLTRTANPLGKLTSYLHEDVEAMYSELGQWTNMKREFLSEISKQKRINMESNQPLMKQLKDLEENIAKEKEEISAIKFNIQMNDDKIRELVARQIITQ